MADVKTENKEKSKEFYAISLIKRLGDIRTFTKVDRLQYSTDTKALLCRGIEANESKTIQYGLKAENGMFYASRIYVPFTLFSLYRKGTFEQSFSAAELRHMIKILFFMQLIDITGHAMLRIMTRPIVNKYVGENELGYSYNKKKLMDDYILQKNYFNNKKLGKEGKLQ